MSRTNTPPPHRADLVTFCTWRGSVPFVLPEGAQPSTQLASLTLADGTALAARLVVGADGAGSAVRAAARRGSWGAD